MTDFDTAIARANSFSDQAIATCNDYHQQRINRDEWGRRMNELFEKCDRCPVTFGWLIRHCEHLIAPIDWNHLAGETTELNEVRSTLMEVPLNQLLIEYQTAALMQRCFEDWNRFPGFRNSELGRKAESALQDLERAKQQQRDRAMTWSKNLQPAIAPD